jgi:cell division septation protein DedD
VDEIPVLTRTQRRLERRQMWMMVILVLAVTVASFFLGVMVGERGAASTQSLASSGPSVAQVAPPPLPASAGAAPRRLTFYEDLPKGNSAPLGSGINLPKGGQAATPAAPVTPTTSTSTAASSSPASTVPVASAPPAPVPAAPKVEAGGSYVVQVISTKDQAEARRVIDKLQGAGIVAHQERVDLGAKGIWFRVVAGPYDGQAAANQAAEQLKQQKYAVMVRKR